VSESERDSCRELSESSVGRRSRVPFGLGFGAHFRRLLEMGEAMGLLFLWSTLLEFDGGLLTILLGCNTITAVDSRW
jgi:hypothetical protein